MTDVVAELDAIIATDALGDVDNARRLNAIVQRARDEIMALRKELELPYIGSAIAAARAEALEEAATACEGSGAIVREARLCAAAIRKLKP